VLEHIDNGLRNHRKHLNNVQKAVFEVELNKSIEGIGGVDGEIPDITPEMDASQAEQIRELRTSVKDVLDKINVLSTVKGKLGLLRKNSRQNRVLTFLIASNQAVIRNLLGPLRSHVPQSKGKYEKTGEFTKEKRAAKMSAARPYKKTGRHINDYLNPRDKKQRDKQIFERARKLGVSTDEFKNAVMPLGGVL
jgi:hypothetical protein